MCALRNGEAGLNEDASKKPVLMKTLLKAGPERTLNRRRF